MVSRLALLLPFPSYHPFPFSLSLALSYRSLSPLSLSLSFSVCVCLYLLSRSSLSPLSPLPFATRNGRPIARWLTWVVEEGIYYNEYCSQWRLDHGLLVVGYGSAGTANATEEVQDYWICKNSYGTGWGTNGYILMARNADNNCGIASHCTYPIM